MYGEIRVNSCLNVLLAAAFAAFVGAQSVCAANVWYVDSVAGQDSYDGSQAERGDGNKGPKRTLAHVGTLLGENDVVYAAPGHYAEGTTNVSGRVYRFYCSANGVKLIGTGGAAVTFIDGEADNSGSSGCGPNSVTCAALTKSGQIHGFTLANGHVQNSDSQYGGGCVGSNGGNAALVDCVVSNCYAFRGGGVASIDWLIRCKFIGNIAVKNEGGAATDGHGYVNCLFVNNEKYDVYAYGHPAFFLNCTSVNGSNGAFRRQTNVAPIRIYNSVLIGREQQNGAYTNCFFTSTDPTNGGKSTTNAECRIVSARWLALDGNYAPVLGSNEAIDAGGEAYYDAVIAEIPAVIVGDAALDVVRRPRVMGTVQDLGAVEYDWLKRFSEELSVCNVTVRQAGAGVALNLDGGVKVPSGETLSLDWSYPSGNRASATFRYAVAISGLGTLKVYRGTATEPAWMFTSLDNGGYSFEATEDQTLRFEMAGGGDAVLSKFSNSTAIRITDTFGDLSVTGGSTGVNEIPAGGALEMSVKRRGESARICFGLRVNGVYRPFVYHDANASLTFSLSDGDGSLAVEAVYADSPGYVVDPENGDDGNDGKATFRAKKSLCTTADLAVSGETVYALPGLHTNGYVTVSSENYRVRVNSGVKIVGVEGAANTIILGAPSDSPVDDYGTGPGAIRCVLIPGNSTGEIIGCTIAGGRCGTAGGYGAGITAGSRVYGALRNCVVTNCVAKRGGAINNLSLAENCVFSGNRATDRNGATGVDLVKAVNCFFNGNFGAYEVYSTADLTKTEFVNCTFGADSEGAVHCNTDNAVAIRNSLVLSKSSSGCYYYNCIHGRNYTSEDVKSTGDSDTRILPMADLLLNSSGRPVRPNHPAIGAGKVEYYHGPNTDVLGNARFSGTIDIGAVEYKGPGAWYVDVENGDDGNDGRSPGTGRAKKTLAAGVALADAGDVVHVAPGVYSEGLVAPVSDITSNRVVVPPWVGLVADGGPDVTFIEGAPSALGNTGVGPGAVRCCYLNANAYIRGFTLRGGYTEEGVANANGVSYSDCGGGICSVASGYSVDCVVSNCCAVRGGGINGGSHFRCRTSGNRVGKYITGSVAASDVYGISAYDSVISGQNYDGNTFVNCTSLDKCWGAKAKFYNCYIGEDNSQANMKTCYTNSFSRGTFTQHAVHDEASLENVSAQFDAAWRPSSSGSVLVDAGLNGYREYMPTGLIGLGDVADNAGGRRIYNGTVDIGAGEYDWRDDFATALKARRLSVSDATETVAPENETIAMADGDVIRFVCNFLREGKGSIETSIVGDGVLSVTFDGLAIEPEAGVYTFPSAVGRHTVVVSFSGNGKAILSRFSNPAIGTTFVIR